MAYKSKYRPKNLEKYIGDVNNVVCRSTWERQLAKYLDRNAKVKKWGMECIIVPYIDKASGKKRRYFIDFIIQFESGRIIIVEVKPDYQTKPPKKRKRTKRYLNEVKTWATNSSKWDAAKKYANKRGWEFQIWTENTLNNLGLKIK